MITITREKAAECKICDWALFDGSPAYDRESDTLQYPDIIEPEYLALLAQDAPRLRWLAVNRLIPVSFLEADRAIGEARRKSRQT